jgi:hypothetical protein
MRGGLVAASDYANDAGARHARNLIHHDLGCRSQAGALTWWHVDPEERRIDTGRGNRTNGHAGVGGIERIDLHHECRTRLAGVGAAGRDNDDGAASYFHPARSPACAMKSSVSRSASWELANSDCRRASACGSTTGPVRCASRIARATALRLRRNRRASCASRRSTSAERRTVSTDETRAVAATMYTVYTATRFDPTLSALSVETSARPRARG